MVYGIWSMHSAIISVLAIYVGSKSTENAVSGIQRFIVVLQKLLLPAAHFIKRTELLLLAVSLI